MRADEIVKRETAIYFKLSRREIEGPSRENRLAHPRQIAMTLCRFYSDCSMPLIGKRFGGRDHTTVIHAMRAVDRRVTDPLFAHEVSKVCALIELEITARRIESLRNSEGPVHLAGLLPPPPRVRKVAGGLRPRQFARRPMEAACG